MPSGLEKRARIVLLAADRLPNAQIPCTAGVSRPTVIGAYHGIRRFGGRYVAGNVSIYRLRRAVQPFFFKQGNNSNSAIS
jgi:hypothetical protein